METYFYDFWVQDLFSVILQWGVIFNVRMMAREQTNKQTSTAICSHIRTQTLNETQARLFADFPSLSNISVWCNGSSWPATDASNPWDVLMSANICTAGQPQSPDGIQMFGEPLAFSRERVVVKEPCVTYFMKRKRQGLSPNMCQNLAVFWDGSKWYIMYKRKEGKNRSFK